MIADVLASIAALLLTVLAFAVRPDSISFRGGWLNGVSPDGWYELRRQPLDPNRGEDPPGVIRARIYCTGGARAIAVDYRTVGCQR